ncbi:MAG: hypothetical protein WB791_04250 [Waddliaceae bacterium]
MRRLIVVLLYFQHSLFCLEIESGIARYFQDEIVLEEGIVLNHELGRVRAKTGIISLLPDHEATVIGEVLVTLKERGELHCDKAHIKPNDLLVSFLGRDRQDRVTYTETCGNDCFAIQSSSITMHMFPTTWGIREIVAEGEVGMALGEDWRGQCRLAKYVDPGSFDFTGDVRVEMDQWGILTTEKGLHLTCNEKKKGEIVHIKSFGETILNCKNKEEDLDLQLVCYEELHIDHEKRTITLNSPANEHSRVEEEKQVFFEDGRGKIFADDAVIDYAITEGKAVPRQLTLKGNVRVYHREGPLLQYVLADVAVLSIPSQEVRFKALGNKRVLLFDRVNQLKISAPEIKVKRDELTKKESIQGIGEVRFCFVEEELNQLRKHFKIDEFKRSIKK